MRWESVYNFASSKRGKSFAWMLIATQRRGWTFRFCISGKQEISFSYNKKRKGARDFNKVKVWHIENKEKVHWFSFFLSLAFIRRRRLKRRWRCDQRGVEENLCESDFHFLGDEIYGLLQSFEFEFMIQLNLAKFNFSYVSMLCSHGGLLQVSQSESSSVNSGSECRRNVKRERENKRTFRLCF